MRIKGIALIRHTIKLLREDGLLKLCNYTVIGILIKHSVIT